MSLKEHYTKRSKLVTKERQMLHEFDLSEIVKTVQLIEEENAVLVTRGEGHGVII